MLTIDRYLRASSLEEAYEAAQKKNSAVLGGMLWLRLSHRHVSTAIDLSALGLCGVEDLGDRYRIGAYTTLRMLETHEGLHRDFGGVIGDALRDIVGVQFRNLATVGGSVFGRFGFSDVVTVFLALGASVELYPSGTVSLETFCGMRGVKDILTHVILPKRQVRTAYRAMRNTATDFPSLNVCAVLAEDALTVMVGARPLCAVAYRLPAAGAGTAEEIAEKIAKETVFASNSRASETYRRHLCRVLVARAVDDVYGKGGEN